MFMFFAFQFDLYKWSVFIASSSTMDRYTLEERSLVYDKRQSYLKWSLVFSQIAMLSVSLFFATA
jgi:hypothetical protein